MYSKMNAQIIEVIDLEGFVLMKVVDFDKNAVDMHHRLWQMNET